MAQYKSYNVSVTQGSNTVNSSMPTRFTEFVRSGYAFKVEGDLAVYTVATVISDTEFTLTSSYQGLTQLNVGYQITTDYTTNFGLAEINIGDKEWPLVLTQETIRKLDLLLAEVISPISRRQVIKSTGIPTTPSSAGEPGYVAYDPHYLYVCVGVNAWKRVSWDSW